MEDSKFMNKGILMAVCLSAFLSTSAFAGKVEDVQAAVKKACGKDVSNADALRLVKALYLSCTPGTKTDADGCQVDCLKGNTGAVVGQ
jgi:hypothetical protein